MPLLNSKLTLAAALLLTLIVSGCHHEEKCGDCAMYPDEPYSECWEGQGSAPNMGSFTLYAREAAGYEAATASFEYATTQDSDRVLNDWDLLFANDKEPGEDIFSVNMVTDDFSAIVDLGRISFCDVKAIEDLHFGVDGDDDVPVVKDHLYLVYTEDTETEQFAAFTVIDYAPDEWVELRWYRSPPSTFDNYGYTPPSFCNDR